MLRKPLAIAAVGVALAAPSAALAAHGPGEQAPRIPRHVESASAYAPVVVVAATRRFSWLDAGIGASVTGTGVLMLVGGRRVLILRRRRIWLDHIS